jgi:hypothetical protein
MGDQEAVPDVLMIPDHNATHRNEYAAVYARVCTAANTGGTRVKVHLPGEDV